MSSITYGGHSFAEYVSAELVEPLAHVVTPETARVPSRPGLMLLSVDVEPLELRDRLLLDAPDALTWHDAIFADLSDWSSLFAEGSAVVTFECLDPIAYGSAASSDDDSFGVGGTWETRPAIAITTSAGGSAQVTDVATGAYMLVERAFAAGTPVSPTARS